MKQFNMHILANVLGFQEKYSYKISQAAQT